MSKSEFLIPCPNCRAVFRWHAESDSGIACDRCLVCGEEFSEVHVEAVRSFLFEDAQEEFEPIPVSVLT